MKPFSIGRLPQLRLAEGALTELPDLLRRRAFWSVALVCGHRSFGRTDAYRPLLDALAAADVSVAETGRDTPPGETFEADPEIVDRYRGFLQSTKVDAVVAIGGGATIDTGKALAAALRMPGSITDYLEGVGGRSPTGDKVPFIAVPTTAGTGSEATKNAVLSRVGDGGFKKSLRHEAYVPDVAIIDPVLHLGCPRAVSAASGLDAITQLLEAYLSVGASPLTDALALDGLRHAGRSFLRAVDRGESDLDARAGMAYAAYLSGVCLANAGLGVVHGLAGPIGALRPVPHGAACGLLLAPAVQRIAGAANRDPAGHPVTAKLSMAGEALAGRLPSATSTGVATLLSRLAELTRVAGLKRLSHYGVTAEEFDTIVAASSNKSSPYDFSAAERMELLAECL